MSRALGGLLVVALEQAVAAPYCTARLADAGARVIKIERAQGDFARGYDSVVHGESAYFVWLNRGKESLVADIKRASDASLLRRILERADVFIQNLAPGATERAGFGSAALHALNPGLIICNISGYGDAGPYRNRKAYDLLIQCEVGLAEITGSVDAPGRVGVSIADIGCGAHAYAGVLEALIERGRTQKGRVLNVSLFGSLADWMTVPLLHQDYGGKAPSRVGISHPSIAPYGMFETSDRQRVVLGIQNEREWAAFCRAALMAPELADDPRFASNEVRVVNRSALTAAINAVTGNIDVETFTQRMDAAQIAYGRLNTVEGLSMHPQLRRVDIMTPSGPVAMPAPPVDDGSGRPSLGAVPAIGEHSAAIRREFSP